ncbi:MAG TPA: hypothetical protein VN659_08390 [Pyrinomonadaceae bacterium]|nr:hypothetical protein [Pyrinomonadaceae bacterium]
MSYDCAGSDETTLAEPDAANDSCICADSYSFFEPRFDGYPLSISTPRSQIVSQHGVWTKKYVVRYMHMLPNANSVFNGYVVANRDAALDKSMIADVAVRTDNNVLQYMSKRPYASARANRICFN